MTIKTIEAGKTVSEFITDLKENFTALHTDIESINDTKQNTIFIAKNNDDIKDADGEIYITVNGSVPSGGKSGDILIIYEE